jgi:hypothetical protein
LYQALIGVTLGASSNTLFWRDNWFFVGGLDVALPALFSHCTAPDITVEVTFQTGELSLPMQDRLSTTVEAELDTLQNRLRHLRLDIAADRRYLLWGSERPFCSSAVCRILKQTGYVAPLVDTNWRNFPPIKVRVFTWVLRHGNTCTRSFLHRYGTLTTDHCPFCRGEVEDIVHLFFACPGLLPSGTR